MSNKSKGSGWERTICKRLSLWASEGDVDADYFWRTAGSGGRSTVRKKKGQSADKHAGDIAATDPRGEFLLKAFAIECKKGYSSRTIQDLLDASENAATQEYQKWIDQAEASRVNSNAKWWMIILKRDKRQPLVIVEEMSIFTLESYRETRKEVGYNRILLELWDQDVVMLKLEDFLSQIKPEYIKRNLC